MKGIFIGQDRLSKGKTLLISKPNFKAIAPIDQLDAIGSFKKTQKKSFFWYFFDAIGWFSIKTMSKREHLKPLFNNLILKFRPNSTITRPFIVFKTVFTPHLGSNSLFCWKVLFWRNGETVILSEMVLFWRNRMDYSPHKLIWYFFDAIEVGTKVNLLKKLVLFWRNRKAIKISISIWYFFDVIEGIFQHEKIIWYFFDAIGTFLTQWKDNLVLFWRRLVLFWRNIRC